MVATVEIQEANSTGPIVHTRVDGVGGNAGTDVRFATTDAVTPIATYPCIIPSAGFNYSYWKHLFLAITAHGGYTTINNIRFYTDGGIGWTCGAGGGLFAANLPGGPADHGCPMDGSYVQSNGTQGTTGVEMIAGLTPHTYYAGGSAVDASTYNSGATLDIDKTDHTGPALDDCKAIVLQVKLDTAANGCVQGTQVDEILTFIYDEI